MRNRFTLLEIVLAVAVCGAYFRCGCIVVAWWVYGIQLQSW